MRRREFITVLGGAAAVWPLAARAQQPALPVIGFSGQSTPSVESQRLAAFSKRLRELGWMEGRTVTIEYRWAEGRDERFAEIAADFVRRKVDVIVTSGTANVVAAKRATSVIPIVFTVAGDPIANNLVESLARPGGNTTGFTNLEPSLGGKWLELLREIAPGVKRVAFMFDQASTPITQLFFRSVESAAPELAVEPVMAQVQSVVDIEAAMSKLGREPGGGLIVPPNTFTTAKHRQIVALALQNRLPSIFAFQYFAAAGGLISYGPDVVDQFQRAASYVDKILRGEPPGDLPVQQPTKFEMVINLKTAKALGLEVPPTLLARADEVIE